MRHAVIMAGGAGTRLWPLSRKLRPSLLAVAAALGAILACRAAREAESNATTATRTSAPETASVGRSTCDLIVSGTVTAIQYLSQYEGSALVAAVDPRFVLSITLSEDAPELGARGGEELHLAIHSAVKTFGTPDDVVGKSFVFSLVRSTHEPRRFIWCQARPVDR